jgi:UTP:GlnB (protein PII) uridylyltransferase
MPLTTIATQSITATSLRARKHEHQLPEIYALEQVVENSIWHDHQNVLDHVLGVFAGLETVLRFASVSDNQKKIVEKYLSEVIGNKMRRDLLTIATLLHDNAKIDTLVTRPDGTAYCPGHELIGASRVKYFSERFGLEAAQELHVERIVRYHGFISEIMNLMIETGDKHKYFQLLSATTDDVTLELVLLMRSDLFGSDLREGDASAYDERINLLNWMFEQLVASKRS